MKNVFACVLLVISVAPLAGGQVSAPVAISSGTRIRVSVDSGPPIVGSVVRLTPEALDLADSRATVTQIPTVSLTSVEISRGRPVTTGHVAKGALKGFLVVGGVATLVILAGDPGWAFVGPLVFGPPGALAGGVLAAMKPPEDWERISAAALASAPTLSTPGAAAVSMPPRSGKGRHLALGALLGAVGGGAYGASNDSATPTGTRVVMFGAVGALLGAGLGALWR
jgi:hypothetical protein